MGKSRKDTACVILAAGLGTRMKSSLPKVLHEISGKTMIERTMELIRPFGFRPSVVVAGYKGREVAKFVKGAKVVKQTKMRGSADAVMRTKGALDRFKGDVVILYSDTPLIEQETMRRLIAKHKGTGAACTLLTARLKDPTGYGRILRDDAEKIARIIEEEETSLYDKVIDEINVGAYCFDSRELFGALKEVRPDNKKKEYYLTDIVSILRKRNLKIESLCTDDEDEAIGVNSKEDLAKAESVVYKRTIKKFLNEGVTIIDPRNTYISADSAIGRDTVIRPYTIIENGVRIGKRCVIGPFARIRPGTKLSEGVEIGNFVEVARSSVGKDTKIKHHSYIGDTVIGEKVNIGAGTITANYDGKKKNRTVIKDRAFIGSGTIFVAPATIGKGAVTGAGCVVTRKTKVPDSSVVAGVPARILKRKGKARG